LGYISGTKCPIENPVKRYRITKLIKLVGVCQDLLSASHTAILCSVLAELAKEWLCNK
jgi:hypothetical protein